MADTIRQLQQQLRELEASTSLSTPDRRARMLEVERRLIKETAAISAASSSQALVAPGADGATGRAVPRSRGGRGVTSVAARAGKKDELQDPAVDDDEDRDREQLMRQRPYKRLRSSRRINAIAQRMQSAVYIGLPIFMVVVGLFGYQASKTWKGPMAPRGMREPLSIETVQWSPDRDVADEILGEERPMLLTNTVATTWPALQNWTLDYLAAKNPFLSEIFSSKSPNFQHFTFDKPMEAFLGLKPKFNITDAPAKDFVKRFKAGKEFLYWSGSVEEIGLMKDLEPYLPLAIKKMPASVNAWVSTKGVVALLHYDAYHNCFVQLKGRKRFTLFPPSSWRYLYLHPLHHPAYRQAQVTIAEPDFRRFPALRSAQPFEVLVEEGQVLFLPPLWFHQVEALEDSISVNVWSYTDAIRDMDEILYLPLPFSEDWSQQKLYDATKVYITMLIEHYLGPSSAPDFVAAILQTRFRTLDSKHLRKFPGAQDQHYCSAEINEAPLRAEMKRGLVQLRKFLDPLPKELRNVAIEDYAQDLVKFTAGLERVPGFLEACFKSG